MVSKIFKKKKIQNTHIPTRFIWGGVVQHDWLRRQRQKCHNCRTECRMQGHNVGQFTPIYKKKTKNPEEGVNYVTFISMKISSLKLRRLNETSGPVFKASYS